MSELATAYWIYRHDLAVIDGIIVKSQRIVVPQKMTECLLQKLHRVHQGVDKSIQRARDKWFWLTGYPWAKPIKNQESDTVVQHFQSVCNQFGYPMEVVSDRGSQSSDFQELCLKFNIIHKPGTPHSQWKNGRCENAIGRLKRLLKKSKQEETSMEDILLNICDTLLDA